MIDKQIIEQLNNLPIEQVAAQLGMQVNRHKSLCPFHADTHPSLTFNVAKNRYRCFACGANGRLIDFVIGVTNWGFKEACLWLASGTWLQSEIEKKHLAIANKESDNKFDASKYERMFAYQYLTEKAKHFLYNERQINPNVVKWSKVKSWKSKQGTEWLSIPYFDEKGALIGVQNRNLDFDPLTKNGYKFIFPRGAKVPVYGLNILPTLRPHDELWIAEGTTDCWALLSSGRPAIAIASATTCRPKDLEIVKDYKEKLGLTIHCAPDQDIAGEGLFDTLKQAIPDIKRHSLPEGCKDFCAWWMMKCNNPSVTTSPRHHT